MPSSRLRELFEHIVDQPTRDREQTLRDADLDDAEREVITAMLAADTSPDPIFDASVADWVAQLSDDESSDIEAMIGQQVGPYTLRALLGQGGSAVVFEAVRDLDGSEQTVALKLLRTGLFSSEARRRFRREQRILTYLEHPHIARLIDGGISDTGIPYIAIEKVAGVGLLEYVRTNALDERACLALLRDLCLAADAAHRALVVHRDLKPANVLIERGGHIKVLDFGVAKLVGGGDPVTATQHISLTPGYAAPEQYTSDGAVTTSVDVYALGVIAGEVLIGARLEPDATLAPDSDGPCRNRWSALDADLKAMLRASTARYANDRYASARYFADDIARYLGGEPIMARAATRRYRLRKLVARNRDTATLLLALFIAIAAGLGVAIWQASRARMQAHRAVLMQTFLVDILGAAETNLPPDQTPTPRQVVKAAIERLSADDSLELSTKADIANTLGSVSHSLGEYEEAEQSVQLALKLRREDPASNTSDILELETNLAEAKFQLSKFDDAAAILAADHQLMVDTNSSSAVNGLAMASDIEAARGNHSAAARLENEAVQKAERVLPAGSRAALVMQIWTGERDPGTRSAYAIAKIGPALLEWRKQGYAEDSDFAHAIGTLAIARSGTGDLGGAEADFIEAIKTYRRIFDGPHARLAWQLEQYGNLLCTVGRFREAELALKEANQMQRKVLGEESLAVTASTNYLAVLELNRRNFAGAQEYARKALRLCLRIPIDGEPCPDAKATLAQVLMQTGRFDEAEAEIDAAVRARERDFGATHPAVAALQVHVAKLRLLQHRWEEALASSDRVLAFESLPHKTRISAESYRAESLHALGRDEESLNQIDAVLSEGQKLSPYMDLRLVPLLALKAEVLNGLGKSAQAREAAKAALALRVAEDAVAPEMMSTLHRLAAD